MALARPKKVSARQHLVCEPCKGQGFAVFLILMGMWWLAQELGWLDFGFSIWPFVLIFFGLYHLVQSSE